MGVTLRCEPDNPVDVNAVRVEVFGQHVGYLNRDHAAMLATPIAQVCGGALEDASSSADGIRGGGDTGHYGIRVWITTADAERIDVRADDLDGRYVSAGRSLRQLPRERFGSAPRAKTSKPADSARESR